MVEHLGEETAEWPVEFHFKLQGDRDLGEGGQLFADQVAADVCVARVVHVDRPGSDSVRVNAIVIARSHDEARERSDGILHAAVAAAGEAISNWSTTGSWCGYECTEIPADS